MTNFEKWRQAIKVKDFVGLIPTNPMIEFCEYCPARMQCLRNEECIDEFVRWAESEVLE